MTWCAFLASRKPAISPFLLWRLVASRFGIVDRTVEIGGPFGRPTVYRGLRHNRSKGSSLLVAASPRRGRRLDRLLLRVEQPTRGAMHADRHRAVVAPQAAVAPITDKCLTCNRCRAEAVRQVVGVVSVETIVVVPLVAAQPVAPSGDLSALEAIDRQAVLEPLDNSMTFFEAMGAKAGPRGGVT